eukprot:GHVR01078459.1.p1 GENE.GHVR01078459.1~~GHVR01078459.1.p1  ORF type:complete len:201 (+),score=38.03 GHVR01078459.1:449-1051(+)
MLTRRDKKPRVWYRSLPLMLKNWTKREKETKAHTIFNKNKKKLVKKELETKQLKKRLGGVFENSDLVLKGLEHVTGVVALLVESDKVGASLDVQDEQDRKQVSLMGFKEKDEKGRTPRARTSGDPVLSVDPRCLSCSGQSSAVLAGFKMACLQYKPMPVKHNGKHFNRNDLLAVRMQLLEQCYDALQTGPDLKYNQSNND